FIRQSMDYQSVIFDRGLDIIICMIFEGQVGQGGINEWNGTNRNGGLVPAGNYLYILTFESNKVLQGYVTVVR
ncbi:MAG: hypothetical protein K2Q22_03375, partial [Cytophagales bacterium]|nr:hypothetical protein [Cytophagales bacterium]